MMADGGESKVERDQVLLHEPLSAPCLEILRLHPPLGTGARLGYPQPEDHD
jgi:hypothetical protein